MKHCTSCGTAISDSEATWCPSCGTKLEAPAAADSPAVATPPPPPAPPAAAAPEAAASPEAAPAAKPRRGLPGWLKVVVPLAGLAVVGFVAYSFLQGSSGLSGGASSPEEAVRELVDALDGEDPLSALAIMSPSEVQAAGDVYAALEDRATETGLTGKSGTYSGVDLGLADLQVEVDELSENAARVKIDDLSFTWAVDPEQLSPTYAGVIEESGAELSGELDLEDLLDGAPIRDLSLIVVRERGGWYVSPLYTAIELGLEAADLPGGDFDAADAERDAPPKDPDELMEALADSVSDLDVKATLDLMSFDALGVANVYEDSIDDLIDELEMELEMGIDDSFDLDIEPPDVTAETRGDLTILTIDEVRGEGAVTDYDGSTVSGRASFDGECIDARSSDDDESEACIPDRFMEVTGLPDLFVVAVKEDGGYRLSPMATLTEYLRIIVENVDTHSFLRALDLAPVGPVDGTLTVGEPIEVELSEAGTFIATFEATEGQVLSFGGEDLDEDREIVLYDPAGNELRTCWGDACVIPIEDAGSHRLLVQSEEWEPASLEIGVHEVSVGEATWPGTVEGSNAPGAVSAFPVDDPAAFEIVSEDVTVWYADADWEEVWDGNELEQATMLIISSSGDFEIELAERPPLGFANGSTQHVGSVSFGGTDSVEMSLGEGYVAVDVSADFDAVLTVYDPYGNIIGEVDDNYGPGGEYLSFEAYEFGTYILYIQDYAGDGGEYTASLSWSWEEF